jgi:4-deoxy-L-threo-5-hexosulose-uronate ketol-isomerase
VTQLLGVPNETRHVIVRDRQAVLSLPSSIHAGVGTCSYRFVWGMAGENRTFEDMDPIDDEVFA